MGIEERKLGMLELKGKYVWLPYRIAVSIYGKPGHSICVFSRCAMYKASICAAALNLQSVNGVTLGKLINPYEP